MFNIMKYRWLFFAISLLVIIPGAISLIRFGLKPVIDFTGGSLLEIVLTQPDQTLNLDNVSSSVKDIYEISSVQPSGKDQYIIRGKMITNDVKNEAEAQLNATFGAIKELRFETVGPVLGKELLQKTLTAAVIVSVMITLYVGWRFSELKYGVCAILAMFHDTLVLLGSFSLLGHFMNVEIDVLFVTAMLTTLSFSVHDTIVVFDRIREQKRKHSRYGYETIVDAAVVETMGRSLNNSFTIIIMLLSLALLGGDTIRWFAVALLIGSVTGTYSSTFTAAPLLLLWDDLAKKFKK
jgi:preprotein translocase subunit SecF